MNMLLGGFEVPKLIRRFNNKIIKAQTFNG
jgi:hypothetical protein